MSVLSKIWPFKRKKKEKNLESFWAKAMVQFRKNKLAVWSLRAIKVLVIIALLADFLANDKPIMCGYNGTTYFPVLKEYSVSLGWSNWPDELQGVDWHELEYDWVLRTPIPWTANRIDKKNADYVGPFDEQTAKSKYWRHWLGTDELGRDVLAGMIHGTRISLSVGLISMAIAAIIGILLGALAGYFGDDRMQVSRIRIILNLLFFLLACFYAFAGRGYALSEAMEESTLSFVWQLFISFFMFGCFMLAANLIAKPLKKFPMLAKKVRIPMDIIVMRIIEIMLSIPTLFLIIALIATMDTRSIFMIMVIIGLTAWTGIARLIRGELLRVRQLEYVEAAQALGFSEVRIILRHAIPNALAPVLIALAFGVASAILTEAFLSFLGLMPADTVTWGSLLDLARKNTMGDAWWLAVFPGLAIFVTVTIMNLMGEGLTDALDPKLRK